MMSCLEMDLDNLLQMNKRLHMYLPQTQVQSLPCLVSHSVTPISCPLPNKTKLKLAQDFKDCRSLCFERKVLIESRYARLWVRCVFGNVLSESFLALSKQSFLGQMSRKEKVQGRGAGEAKGESRIVLVPTLRSQALWHWRTWTTAF